MSLVVSEHEMIERFVAGCNEAGDRAKQFLKCEENEKPRLFTEFAHGLKVAAGSAHQLAITQENPNFLNIRDVLEKVIAGSQDLVTCGPLSNGSWLSISKSLEGIALRGQRMARAKAMSRTDVLANLDVRQIKLNQELNATNGQSS